MSLTSYRAAPPRDQGASHFARQAEATQGFSSKRADSVPNPVTKQFWVFQINTTRKAPPRPVGARVGNIRRARIKFYLRRVMPETRQRPPRMIPRSDQDDAARFLFAEQFDGQLRIFPGGARLGFQFNHLRRHAVLNQQLPVDFAIATAADDDTWRGVFLEKFRRAFRPLG